MMAAFIDKEIFATSSSICRSMRRRVRRRSGIAVHRAPSRRNAARPACARLLNRSESSRPRRDLQRPSWSPVGGVSQNGCRGGRQGVRKRDFHTNDLAAAQSGLLAGISEGQFSGAALGHVQAILSDLTTAISAANASVGGGSTPGAEQALRASHLSILNTVSTDPVLANPAGQKAPTEPVPAPEAAPAEKTAATAPDANSAETTDLAEAGDAENTAQIDEHLDAA